MSQPDYPVGDRRWRLASIGLAGLGLADSAYLAWAKLGGSSALCAGFGDCEVVNASRYSEVAGVPVALLGALAYLALITVHLAEARYERWAESLRLAAFGLTLTGTLYSGYLTYVELAILRAICPFCVLSAIIITMLLGISFVRLRSSLSVAGSDLAL